jgi:hypothetical protein
MHSLAYSTEGLTVTMITELICVIPLKRRAERRIGIPTDLVGITVDSCTEYLFGVRVMCVEGEQGRTAVAASGSRRGLSP